MSDSLSADVVYAAWEKLDRALERAARKLETPVLEFLINRAEGNMLVQEVAARVLAFREVPDNE
jgi:hypothetical protein